MKAQKVCGSDRAAYMRGYRKRRKETPDFALLMHKRFSERITRSGGDGMKNSSPDMLRAIMMLQGNRDPFSHYPFVLPCPRNAISKTWKQWINSLAAVDRDNTPELVIDDPILGWVPGNMFFISNFWLEAYRRAGSLGNMLTRLRSYSTDPNVIIPTADAVKDTLSALRCEQSRHLTAKDLNNEYS